MWLMAWRKLSSKILFDHPRLLVEEDEVELPNGEKIHYLRYGYKGHGVVIICQNNKNEILFQKEYSYIPNKPILQFPMGRIEENEDIEEGAKRELLEETGLKANQLKLIGQYYQNHRRSRNTAYVFLATELEETEANPEKEEGTVQVVWLDKDRIQKMIKSGEIIDSDTLSSLEIYSPS